MTLQIIKYLADAQLAASSISEFLEGKTREDFTASLLLRSAVERQFEIVGLRNRIAYSYDSINHELLWTVFQVKLPLLQTRLLELLQ